MSRIIAICCGILLLAGCAAPSVTVVSHKEPTRPYAKVLAIYLDESCDLTMFDSMTYNICIRSAFMNRGSLEVRTKVENLLADKLTSAGTSIIKASALFKAGAPSYDDFNTRVRELGVDAILLINFSKYMHDEYINAPNRASNGIQINSGIAPGYKGNGPERMKLNSGFECYLMLPKDMRSPVWVAQIGSKGNRYSGKKGLDEGLVRKLETTLKHAGYIAY